MSYTTGVLDIQAPDCTEPEVKNISLSGFIFLGSDSNGGLVSYYQYADHILETLDNTLNVQGQLQVGKRVFLVKSPSGNFTLTNVPSDDCSTKEIWVKNATDTPLTVYNAVGTIDGKISVTLQARECLHLAYAVSDSEWVII